MKNKDYLKAFKIIKEETKKFNVPSVTLFSYKKNPYLVLVSCILSLRTKDKTTIEASNRLFKVARSPQDMIKLSKSRIEKIIYPVGFFRNKAGVILDISRRLISDFSAKVPSTLDELLSLKGVGRKTANLVLGLGFATPAICVHTHVNRIPNRLGWVKTDESFETEKELELVFPKKNWIELNTVLVAFGQNICLPVKPHCCVCPVEKYCRKIGVNN